MPLIHHFHCALKQATQSPTFSLFIVFSAQVTPWAHLVSLGTSTAFVAWSAFQAHPTQPGASLFHLEAALMMTPGFLSGNFLGSLMEGAFPRWFMFLILVVLIALVLWKVTVSFLRVWRAEVGASASAALEKQALVNDDATVDASAAAADADVGDKRPARSATCGTRRPFCKV